MLSNAYFLAKFRFDTAENEPAKYLQNLQRKPLRSVGRQFRQAKLDKPAAVLWQAARNISALDRCVREDWESVEKAAAPSMFHSWLGTY